MAGHDNVAPIGMNRNDCYLLAYTLARYAFAPSHAARRRGAHRTMLSRLPLRRLLMTLSASTCASLSKRGIQLN